MTGSVCKRGNRPRESGAQKKTGRRCSRGCEHEKRGVQVRSPIARAVALFSRAQNATGQPVYVLGSRL